MRYDPLVLDECLYVLAKKDLIRHSCPHLYSTSNISFHFHFTRVFQLLLITEPCTFRRWVKYKIADFWNFFVVVTTSLNSLVFFLVFKDFLSSADQLGWDFADFLANLKQRVSFLLTSFSSFEYSLPRMIAMTLFWTHLNITVLIFSNIRHCPTVQCQRC